MRDTRRNINYILNFINSTLQIYNEPFNIYFTGGFVNIPDLITYVQYYTHTDSASTKIKTHTYDWLNVKTYVQKQTNILYYACLLYDT